MMSLLIGLQNFTKRSYRTVGRIWNTTVIGKNKDGIIKNFKKLKSNPADYWEKDLSGDEESLGIIKNFNKDEISSKSVLSYNVEN